MRHILTSLILAGLPLLSKAQCDQAIPSNASVIDADGSYSIFGGQWVCSGVNASLSSGFVNAYIEGGANVTVGSNLGIIWVKGNSVLTLNGTNNNIYHESTVTIIDNGASNFLNPCTAILFDYENAPAPGCIPTASEERIPQDPSSVVLSMDRTQDVLDVQVAGGMVLDLQLLDARGRLIKSAVMTNRLQLGGLTPGPHLVRVRTGAGWVAGTLVIH